MAKGQTQVLELVVLFGIGLSIVTGFLVAFGGFGERVKNEAVDQQSKIMGDLVSSNLAFFLQLEAEEGSSMRFVMPRSLAGESFSVNLSDAGVNVLMDQKSFVSNNLNGLEEKYVLEGLASSDLETVEVTFEDNTVSIGG